MSKELELFKRWFGIEIKEYESCLDRDGVYTIHIDKYMICVWPPTSIKKEQILKLIESEYFLELDAWVDAPIFKYKIPPQYHAEWQQYVKDMKYKKEENNVK